MWNVKQIHNISRPGEAAADGDMIEVELVGGFVRQVDPVTRQCRDAHQRFRVSDHGVTLTILKGK